jgi:hypothetical protein
VVWAIRTGADATEAAPLAAGLVKPGPVEAAPVEAAPVESGPVESGPGEVVGEEPQAARVIDSSAMSSPRPVPWYLVGLLVRVISACPHDPRGRDDGYLTSFALTVSGKKCWKPAQPRPRRYPRTAGP